MKKGPSPTGCRLAYGSHEEREDTSESIEKRLTWATEGPRTRRIAKAKEEKEHGWLQLLVGLEKGGFRNGGNIERGKKKKENPAKLKGYDLSPCKQKKKKLRRGMEPGGRCRVKIFRGWI